MTSPAVVPLDPADAERIAVIALRPGARTVVGPRVLAGLLARIAELTTERALLRRELDQLHSYALEDARLRAHKMWAEQRGGAVR